MSVVISSGGLLHFDQSAHHVEGGIRLSAVPSVFAVHLINTGLRREYRKQNTGFGLYK